MILQHLKAHTSRHPSFIPQPQNLLINEIIQSWYGTSNEQLTGFLLEKSINTSRIPIKEEFLNVVFLNSLYYLDNLIDLDTDDFESFVCQRSYILLLPAFWEW